MRGRLQRVIGTGLLLLLAAGCAPGAGGTTDLPHPRPLPRLHDKDDVVIPVDHPPDARVVAREPYARWENHLNLALFNTLPISWVLMGLAIAF